MLPSPRTTPPVNAPVLTSAPPPASVQIVTITTPEAPTGGIAIGSDASVYLSGVSSFIRYTGTFRQFAYPVTAGAPPPNAEPSDNAMASGPGQEISVVLGSAFPGGPPITYIGALDPASGHTIDSGILTTFLADSTIGVANTGHNTVAAMQSLEGGTDGIVTLLNTSLAAVGGFSGPDDTLVNTATVGPDGAIYAGNLPTFDPVSGTTSPSRILRIDFFSKAITSVTLPSGSQVEQIAPGPDGALWFTDPGLNKIGRVTTSLSFTYFTIPTPASGLAGITAASDNAMWFTESAKNKIGRIATSGAVNEYQIQNGTHPLGIAAGAPGACIPQTIYFAVAEGLGKLTFSQ
jgi:hypothetical protein